MHVSESNDHIISHDPATYQAKTVTPIEKPKKPVIILAVVGLLLVIVGGIWYFNGKSFDFSEKPSQEFNLTPVDDSVIAVVGAENIYAEDLNYKLRSYPENMGDGLRNDFKKQLIEDSIILQAGAEANYIELSENVFNTVTKNQTERGQLIEKVKKAVDNDAASTKGAYVTIWFMNDVAGPIGYDAGKKVAFDKITALHQAVSSGEMTIAQAGDAVKGDTSLEQLDSQYIANAYNEFNTSETPSGLTFSSEFNQALLALETGETTKVFTIQDYENRKFNEPKKDAYYMFGQVTERNSKEGITFDKWLRAQKENYAVTEL